MNQTNFLTAESQARHLLRGGQTYDYHFGLASRQYATRVAGGLWRVSEATRFDWKLDAGAHAQKTRQFPPQAKLVEFMAEQPLKESAFSARKKALLRKTLRVWRKRLPRLDAQLAQGQQIWTKHQAATVRAEQLLAELKTWHTQLENGNRANPQPPAYVEARMDAGFGSDDNLTWLVEMGYCPNTKAPSDQTTRTLRKQLPAEPD